MVAFALELAQDDGSTIEVPIVFGPPTADEMTVALALAGNDPHTLAAAAIFTRTGRPISEWALIGPVLRGVISGDDTSIRIRED